MLAAAAFGAALLAGAARAQVTATGTMGVTNPTAAVMGTPVNQTSYARLLSLNAIDDFCLFAPPEANSVIGETEEIEVAWCVQPRNNARVIPDGVLQAVHFVKTPLYWQIQGWGDFTKLNIQDGDEGGELDPHGATGNGNPVGGNVTTNATGSDVSYEEWMNYMAYDQFCLRICIAENSTYSAAIECEHTFDLMGCQWVMPGDYTNNSFTECDADSAYPPGVYPLDNGTTSTFAQRYTGTYTITGTELGTYTIGYTVTPQQAYSTPASSNCITYSTVSNGIPTASLTAGAYFTWDAAASLAAATATATASSGSSAASSGASATASASSSGSKSAAASGASSTSTSKASGSASASKSAASGSASASASGSSSGALSSYASSAHSGLFAGAFSVLALLAGAGVVFL
ncbi:hypothetical protein Q5752_002974 [Cryptotrichosporon argae]